MRNFVILFNGHEGSSAIISHLKNYQHINIIWYEPFDNCHLTKPLQSTDLYNVITHSYKGNFGKANFIYKNYSSKPLVPTRPLSPSPSSPQSIGFKMRIKDTPTLTSVFKDNSTVVFILFRKNILKHAISKISPHNQFAPTPSPNPSFTVNFPDLTKQINICKDQYQSKTDLLFHFQSHSIDTYPIYYEDFLADKIAFFTHFLTAISYPLPLPPIVSDSYFKKVHPNDPSKFIENYPEFLEYVKKNNLEKYIV